LIKKLFVSLSMLLFLSCIRAPDIKEPEVDISPPDSWIAGDARSPSQKNEENSDWWQHFHDPALDSLIRESLRHNHNLQAASARVDMAISQARISSAELYPQLNGGVTAARRKQQIFGMPSIGGTGESSVSTMTSNNFGASLDVSWEIDLWGRIRSGRSAALADVQASQVDWYGAKLSLTGQLAKMWYAAIELNRQVDLSQAALENYQLSVRRIKERYEKGLVSSLDYRMAESAVATAEANFLARQQQLESARRQLEIMLGRYPAAEIEINKNAVPHLEYVPAGLPAELVSKRPDLISAERRIAAAKKRVSQAKASLYPRIALTGSAGQSSSELENLLDGDFSVWSIIGNIVHPLFQGGRLLAGVKSAQSNAEMQLAQFAQSLLNAYAEVENALAAERYLAGQETALETAAHQAAAACELAEDRYRRGLVNVFSMLEAQRNSLQAESQLINIRRQRIDARVDLCLGLGGGIDMSGVLGESKK